MRRGPGRRGPRRYRGFDGPPLPPHPRRRWGWRRPYRGYGCFTVCLSALGLVALLVTALALVL
ncbi:hypothetical protein LJC74_05015 [Eubacteriales bacterium OttesenSCG-928-A19]|nr:hypothetical protein [Eubacteriales bacterium OttesenSCG-928-A19]